MKDINIKALIVFIVAVYTAVAILFPIFFIIFIVVGIFSGLLFWSHIHTDILDVFKNIK